MRKFMNIFAAALVMLAAASCEKNEVLPDNNSEGKVVTLKASINNNGGTKTSLGGKEGDEYPVLWSEGDEIALIQGTNVCVLTLSDGIGEKSATFTGTLVDGFNLNNDYTAFYPASAVDENGNISIPDTQIYAEGSFGLGAMPMAAIKSDETLNFMNLFGVLKLTLTGNENETVQSVRVASSNGTIMNGPIELSLAENSSITANMGGQLYANQMVTLNCNNGVALTQSGVQFLISVPAGQHNFCVTVITKDENNNTKTYYKKTANTNSFTASSIKNMPPLSLSGMVMGTDNSYVENGVYLGEGVALPKKGGGTYTWAPVNCGTDDNNKYGLLYQWGRKYGQGTGEVTVKRDKCSLADGSDENNKNIFYGVGSDDWVQGSITTGLWNSGSEHNPCPDGWRVPTLVEFQSAYYYDTWFQSGYTVEKDGDDLIGHKFYGYTTDFTGNYIFLPAVGMRNNSDGIYYNNVEYYDEGYYWTSDLDSRYKSGHYVNLESLQPYSGSVYWSRAGGLSVRCIKE